MSDTKITKTATIRISGGKTAGELLALIKQVPENSRASVVHHPGDSRDQREYAYTDLTFTWTD